MLGECERATDRDGMGMEHLRNRMEIYRATAGADRGFVVDVYLAEILEHGDCAGMWEDARMIHEHPQAIDQVQQVVDHSRG